jgi:hypothetical protein
MALSQNTKAKAKQQNKNKYLSHFSNSHLLTLFWKNGLLNYNKSRGFAFF